MTHHGDLGQGETGIESGSCGWRRRRFGSEVDVSLAEFGRPTGELAEPALTPRGEVDAIHVEGC
jgi:hypothetical protein